MEIILKYFYKFNLYRKVNVYHLIYENLFLSPRTVQNTWIRRWVRTWKFWILNLVVR